MGVVRSLGNEQMKGLFSSQNLGMLANGGRIVLPKRKNYPAGASNVTNRHPATERA
jgi:hypothetical protein